MGNEITTNVRGGEIAARENEGFDFFSLVEAGSRMVKTGFLPDHIRTGEQFAAIVLTGREMGIPAMRAIRSLMIVKGNVVEKADSQLARFKESGGRAEFEVLDETRAVLHLTHPNGDKHTETWTVDDSRKAGLTGGNHSKFPRAMIRSRCITAALKSIGWGGAVGNYDPDELREAMPTEKRAEPAKRPGWRDRVAAAATVEELGRIGDEADQAVSEGRLTPEQRGQLDTMIDARQTAIEAGAEVQP
jgi:hypothetical protein